MRVGAEVLVLNNRMSPELAGAFGIVIWRRGKWWVRVRIDKHEHRVKPHRVAVSALNALLDLICTRTA